MSSIPHLFANALAPIPLSQLDDNFAVGGAYTPSGTGAVSTTVQAKLRESVSVNDFGAVGDGVTDDTSAIQAALNAGYEVYIPPGNYLCTALNVPSNTALRGAGSRSMLVQSTTTLLHLLNCNSGSSAAFINNITLSDFALLGQVASLGFYEQQHLISFSGVANLIIERCTFTGFRGDGVYIGSGLAGQERHNLNVSVSNCRFDGVNSDNRNAISVIDGDDVRITNNHFANCTRSTMPGAIDCEPDANAFHVIRNIHIEGNHFSNVGGNVAVVSFPLAAAAFTNQPKNISVKNNTFDCPGAANFFYINTGANVYAEPLGIIVSGNTGNCGRLFNFGSASGAIVSSNSAVCPLGNIVGFTATDTVSNVLVSGNLITGNASSPGVIVRGIVSDISISNNVISGFTNGLQLGIASGSISKMKVLGNAFKSNTTDIFNAGGTIDGSTCVYKDNLSTTNNHQFPAWITDNCGVVINTNTASSFNTATLPDSFPVGISMAVLNGDTGVPAGTGGTEGILITTRMSGQTGYEKFTSQQFWHASNTVKLGSFFMRRRDQTTNTWLSWTEQAL